MVWCSHKAKCRMLMVVCSFKKVKNRKEIKSLGREDFIGFYTILWWMKKAQCAKCRTPSVPLIGGHWLSSWRLDTAHLPRVFLIPKSSVKYIPPHREQQSCVSQYFCSSYPGRRQKRDIFSHARVTPTWSGFSPHTNTVIACAVWFSQNLHADLESILFIHLFI